VTVPQPVCVEKGVICDEAGFRNLNGNSFSTHRPFRAPRYTISDVGLIGGLDESEPR
jgi:predicted ATPase with chaperone activity